MVIFFGLTPMIITSCPLLTLPEKILPKPMTADDSLPSSPYYSPLSLICFLENVIILETKAISGASLPIAQLARDSLTYFDIFCSLRLICRRYGNLNLCASIGFGSSFTILSKRSRSSGSQVFNISRAKVTPFAFFADSLIFSPSAVIILLSFSCSSFSVFSKMSQIGLRIQSTHRGLSFSLRGSWPNAFVFGLK